jgi:carotenoid cleavage dioxygenase-like enzyme
MYPILFTFYSYLHICKLNVDTGEEIHYTFPEGLFVQEPNFVPHPKSSSEDDGVIVAQGIDGRKHKGTINDFKITSVKIKRNLECEKMTNSCMR